jgi:hypothetical protein
MYGNGQSNTGPRGCTLAMVPTYGTSGNMVSVPLRFVVSIRNDRVNHGLHRLYCQARFGATGRRRAVLDGVLLLWAT